MSIKHFIISILFFSPIIAHAEVGDQYISGALDVGSFPVEEKSGFSKGISSDNIDWDHVPRVKNLKELHAYMQKCAEQMMTSVPVVCVNGYNPNLGDGINATSVYWVHWTVVGEENGEKRFFCKMIYRSGARIAHAYLTGDTSDLTEKELKVYHIAVQIVKMIRSMNATDLVKLLYIHDSIINRCSYLVEKYPPYPDVPYFTTALGVFLDHKANCQGYSDSFYMLGRMAGYKVGYLHGVAGKGKHIWNTIELDGKVYCVDATWNDKEIRLNDRKYAYYVYFIAPREIMEMTHEWDKSYELSKIEDDIDENYFYATIEHYDTDRKMFGSEEDSAEGGLAELADGIANEHWTRWYVMVPYDKYYCNPHNSVKFLTKELNKLRYKCSYDLNVSCNQKWAYMFYTVIVR